MKLRLKILPYLLVTSALVCLPYVAIATTAKQYLNLRSKLRCDLKLSYSKVLGNPSAFVGRVFELRGTVGGAVGTDSNYSIMLNMPDSQTVLLDVPPADIAEIREQVSPSVRVLVEVKEGASGNVVPLRSISFVLDSSVTAIEKEEQARLDAARKRSEWKQQQDAKWRREVDRVTRNRSANNTASRGGSYRTDTPLSPSPGHLSARAAPLYAPYYHFIANHNRKLSPTMVANITHHLLNFADRYNVDPRLVVAMIIAESDFNPNTTSHAGAMGLGQLMPGTARYLGVRNAYDPVENLNGSIAYLRTQLDSFASKSTPGGGYSFEQIALAMASYNAGPNAVKKHKGIPPYRETQFYVRRVTSLYRQLCSED